jgi:hypothetical protein
MRDPRLGLRRQGLIFATVMPGRCEASSSDAQLRIGESRDSGFASRPRMTLEQFMQFDTKIAAMIRTDLETWQKLNVASFLAVGPLPQRCCRAFVRAIQTGRTRR